MLRISSRHLLAWTAYLTDFRFKFEKSKQWIRWYQNDQYCITSWRELNNLMWGQKELSLSWAIEASLYLQHIGTSVCYIYIYIYYTVFMYTDVHVNPEPEHIQATNCLTSMQEYQLEKSCCNFSTHTTGNTSKEHCLLRHMRISSQITK